MRIHHTMGVYNDGSRKHNGVSAEHLAGHIEYNLAMRPGRAFFVDGVCHNVGYLGTERCIEIEREWAEKPVKFDRCTAPYQ